MAQGFAQKEGIDKKIYHPDSIMTGCIEWVESSLDVHVKTTFVNGHLK